MAIHIGRREFIGTLGGAAGGMAAHGSRAAVGDAGHRRQQFIADPRHTLCGLARR